MPLTWKKAQYQSNNDIPLQTLQEQWQQRYGFSSQFIELLWLRGVRESTDLDRILSSDNTSVYHYWKLLPGAEEAAARLINEAKAGNRILIYGDYDVDGITSTSILWNFLYRDLKADAVPFIPHREREGYGLNRDTVEQLLVKENIDNKKVTLVTVDCGIRDSELIRELKLKYKNLQVIITDHHQLPQDFDKSDFPADLLVHPQLPQSKVDPREICAAAVVWGIVCAAASKNTAKTSEVERPQGLELVALATVCDIMPLIGLNRDIVKAGLTKFSSTESVGVRALMQMAGIREKTIYSYHLGFVLGPRINAAGRIGEPIDAVRMLCTQDYNTALKLAVKLDELNKQRRAMTTSALETTGQDVDTSTEKLIFVENRQWKEGVVGLIAGKLSEKFQLPVIAATENSEGEWVGSARSVEGFDITKALTENADILKKYGGHAEAAGFTVSADKLSTLKQNLQKQASETIIDDDSSQIVKYDLQLQLNKFREALIEEISQLEPFGNANEQPIFLLQGEKLSPIRYFGRDNKHVKLETEKQSPLEFIWFNHQFPRGSDISSRTHHDLLGYLGYNEWNGKKIPQFNVRKHRISNNEES
jgi:single-stranded-DNA-specific exonuclease